jgi:hypothetical protein
MILHIFQIGDGETSEEVAMDVRNQKQAEQEAERMQAHHEELVDTDRYDC